MIFAGRALINTAAAAVVAGIVAANEPATIVDLALAVPDLSTLVAAVTAVELVPTLADPQASLTVFAPTNQAFADIQDIVDFLLVDKDYSQELLTRVLTYHVSPGVITSDQLGTSQPTVNGNALSFSGTVINGNSNVVLADQLTGNGVAHVIDAVLVPPNLPTQTLAQVANDKGLNILLSALGATGQAKIFTEPAKRTVYTVFAPSDAAFEQFLDDYDLTLEALATDRTLLKLLRLLLAAHVVRGEAATEAALLSRRSSVRTLFCRLSVQREITPALSADVDNEALDGILHVIDHVIEPRFITSRIKRRVDSLKAQGSPLVAPADGADNTIAKIAASSDGLSTLLAAARIVEFDDDLDETDDTYTVFAPTDAAFAAIQGVLDFLLVDTKYAKSLLETVLTYHVLDGAKKASELGASEVTLSGESLSIDASNGVVINGASSVVSADIEASNGVVHLVNAVLVPPSLPLVTIADIATSTPAVSILTSILVELDLVGLFTTAGKSSYTVFAPSDDAFAALASSLGASVPDLLATDGLKRIVRRIVFSHVSRTEVMSSEQVQLRRDIKTLDGRINLGEFVRGNVIAPDNYALNGVVHVVSKVIVRSKYERALSRELRRKK